ncbi:MAG TPA: PorT family protein, partial [Flavisolibacter sp.]
YNAANAATQFEKFDAGGNLLVGYEFANRLSFQLNAQLGLVDINKENPANTADKTRWRNTGFGLSMGFRF